MNTLFRRLAAIAAGVAVALLALLLLAAWWFDADALRSEIEQRVESETGFDLSISGDVSAAWFPGLGVRVGHATLRSPAETGEDALAEFETLALRVKLLPLLAGKVVPDRVAVDGLELRLVRSASGRRNFDGLLGGTKHGGDAPVALLPPARLELASAAASYVDEATGKRLRITGLDLLADMGSGDPPGALSARFGFNDSARGVAGHASVDADVLADAAAGTFSVRSLTAEIDLRRGPGVPAEGVSVTLSAQVRLDAPAGQVSIENVELAGSGPGFTDLPMKVSIPRMALDLRAGTAALERFTAEAAGLDLDGGLTVRELGGDPELHGRVAVAPFRPSALSARLGWPLPDALKASLPGEARLETSVYGGLNGLAWHPFSMTLDGMRVSGRIDTGFGPQWPVSAALSAEGLSAASGDPLELTLRGSGRAPEEPATYRIEALELVFGPVIARGTLDVTATGGVPRYTGSLEVPVFDPRSLLDVLGRPAPVTRDSNVLKRAAARVALSGSGPDLVLDPLTLELDDTVITGAVSLSNLLGPAPAVSFALRADALDAGRYLPISIPGSDEGAAPGVPLDILRSLNAEGHLKLASLTVGDVVMRDVRIVARAKDGEPALRTGSESPRSQSRARVASSDALPRSAP